MKRDRGLLVGLLAVVAAVMILLGSVGCEPEEEQAAGVGDAAREQQVAETEHPADAEQPAAPEQPAETEDPARSPDIQKSNGGASAEPASKVTLSGKLSANEYAPGDDIQVTAVVTNGGDAPITLDEGGFMAVFIVDGEAKTFLQGVRASYASGTSKVTVNPGETYEEPFVVMPKEWGQQRALPPGQHHMRISYCGGDRTWRPSVDRRSTRIEDGVLVRLDSEEIAVGIK